MTELLMVILKIYLATVGISGVTKFLKERKANKIIEKNGFDIVMGDKEPQELIADFIKDNFYILLPLKNIKKTWKLIWGSNKKYASAKMNNLKQDNRLIPIEEPKKIEEPKEETKKITKTEKPLQKTERKQETKNNTKKETYEDLINTQVTEIANMDDISLLNEIRQTYKEKSIELRQKYTQLLNEFNKSTSKEEKMKIKTEVSNICKSVKVYDAVYKAALSRLVQLRNESINKAIK